MSAEERARAEAEEKRRAARDIGSLMTRNVVTQGLGLARHFVILPLITPAQLAIFRYVTQLVAYSHLFHFGAMATFKVKYPEWWAAQRGRDCDVLQTVAWRQIGIGAALFAPLLALVLLYQADIPPGLVAVIALGGAAPLFADYAVASFNVRGRFRDIAQVDVIVAVVAFVALFVGAALFGVYGLIVGALIGPALRCVLASEYFWPRPYCWPGRAEFRGLFLFGSRIWLGSAISTLAASADIILLGVLVGHSSPELGAYALALMVCRLLSQDVRAVTIVHQRNLQILIGREQGVTNSTVRRAVREYAAVDCYLGALFACVAVVLTATLLPIALPQHAAAVPLVGPLACSFVLLRAKRYTTTALNQAGRVNYILLSSSTQLAMLVLGFALLSHRELDIEYYALVHLGAFSTATVMETILSHRVMGAAAEGVSFAGRLLLGTCPLLAGVGLSPFFLDSPGLLILSALSSLVLATITCWVVLGGVPRPAGELLREVLRGKLRLIRRSKD